MDTKLIQKSLKISNFTTTYAMYTDETYQRYIS